MPVVGSDRCLLHEPAEEIWVGVPTPAAETPDRIERIRAALAGARFVEAERHAEGGPPSVHDESLVRYLASAWDEWQAAGLPNDPGQHRVVPYVFAHAALGEALEEPTAVWGRPGWSGHGTMTLIGPGTRKETRGAVCSAL